MTINVGELELLISERGIENVLRGLGRVNVAAKAADRPVVVPVSAPGADRAAAQVRGLAAAFRDMGRAGGATRGLEAMAARVQMLGQGMQFASTRGQSLASLARMERSLQAAVEGGNLRLEERIALEARLAGVRGAMRTAVPGAAAVGPKPGLLSRMGIGAGIGGLAAGLGVGLSITAAMSGLQRISQAADAAENAQRKLSATSRITGIELGTMTGFADMAAAKFRLSASAAADLAIGTARIAQSAGKVGETGQFMTAWMDLAAARGLSAADAMQALETTLIGQDEGLNRLGLQNPQQIYEKWAGAIGVAASQMDQGQKNLAVMLEVQSVASAVTGEYERKITSAAGKQDLMAQSTERMWQSLGQMLIPLREVVYDLGTRFTEWVVQNAGPLKTFGHILGGVLAVQFNVVGFALGTVIDVIQFGWNAAVGMLFKGAELALSALAKLERGFSSIARAVGLDALADKYGAAAANLEAVRDSYRDVANTRLSSAGDQIGQIGQNARSAVTGIRNAILGNRAAAAAGALGAGNAPGTGGTGTGGTGGGGGGGGGSSGRSLAPLIGQGAPGLGTVGLTSAAVALRPLPLPIVPTLNPSAAVQAILARTGEIQAGFQTAARSLGDLFTNAFGAAFEGGMSSAGDMLIGGLGSIMVSFGQALVPFGALMEKFAAAVAANPILAGPVGIMAGLALIALGSTLRGAAGGKSRGGGGGRGGGAGGAAFGDQTTRIGLGGTGAIGSGQVSPVRTGADAKAATLQPVQVNATIIGANDPQAARTLAGMVQRHLGRGA